MASVEFIQKRIAGKEAEIAKLEKKMERILKAQEGNWEINNPYSYSEYDLRVTTHDLEAAKEALADYQDKLYVETQKAASRNIPAILDFLDQWKTRVMDYYKEEFKQHLIAREEWYAYDHRHTEWSNREGHKMYKENREEYDRISKEYRQKREAYRSRWNFITPYINYTYDMSTGQRGYFFDEEKFQKVLDQEANAKYDFIVERTNAIVGQITDASDLKVGNKGDLNGIIIGTDGKAKVETIGAAGYNIQCFHYRTLIKEVK